MKIANKNGAASTQLLFKADEFVLWLREQANQVEFHQANCKCEESVYGLHIRVGYDGQDGFYELEITHVADCDWIKEWNR